MEERFRTTWRWVIHQNYNFWVNYSFAFSRHQFQTKRLFASWQVNVSCWEISGRIFSWLNLFSCTVLSHSLWEKETMSRNEYVPGLNLMHGQCKSTCDNSYTLSECLAKLSSYWFLRKKTLRRHNQSSHSSWVWTRLTSTKIETHNSCCLRGTGFQWTCR